MNHPDRASLCLTLESDLIPRFFQFLQQGFMVEANTGCDIKTLLCDQLGLNPEYLEKRIQTIFLDGSPVDDVNTAMIKHGSTLALSAAMPGLLGATLRKGSYYATMRSQISYGETARPTPTREGIVILKFFNLLIRELGPIFLKKGVWIKGKDLEDFFRRQSDRFWSKCKEARVDGERIDLERLADLDWTEKQVFLQVQDS